MKMLIVLGILLASPLAQAGLNQSEGTRQDYGDELASDREYMKNLRMAFGDCVEVSAKETGPLAASFPVLCMKTGERFINHATCMHYCK